ncbi:MAG: GNAT family N-acetyltransferase [Nitrospirae bacterium]|nr:MAG: GNAT family N-acetyltransferase [Nitrospirota bacterium]
MEFPIDAKLKDGTPIQLILADHRDNEPLRRLFEIIIEEGASYPHDRPPDEDDFLEYWFKGKSTIVAYPQRSPHGPDLLGAFYLKPNWPGRARHVANAGFMVAPQWRNKGLGWLLGAVMLQYATELGYRSVIFNLVFAENQVARRLWRKLGFSELAVLPGAVLKNDRTYQDAIIMWKSLLP